MNKRQQERFVNSVLLGYANGVESATPMESVLINDDLRQRVKDVEFLRNNICSKPYIDEFDNGYYYGLRQIEYQVIARKSRRRRVKAVGNFFIVVACVCLIVLCVVALL